MPVPTKGEVLVDVYAAGMNFLELVLTSIRLPHLTKVYIVSYKPKDSTKVNPHRQSRTAIDRS
jgi:NADPH:quinone reductase-like Zn-dependent oxidoreductase